MTHNTTEGWQTASPVYVDANFKGELRNYKGEDVGFSAQGANKAHGTKDKKHMAGTNLGSIYRDRKKCNVLSTAMADKHFLGSLRSEQRMSTEEYQQKRRQNLNLPQFRELSSEQVTKAKRLFASIDLDGSGTLDAEELRKFLQGMGHESGSKAVQKLLKAADEGVKDSKLQLQEFCRVYHGLKLDG